MGFLSTIGSWLGSSASSGGSNRASDLTRYRPPSLNFLGGGVGYNQDNNSFNFNSNPQMQGLYQQLLSGAGGFLGGVGGAQAAAPNLSSVTGAVEGSGQHPLAQAFFGQSQGFLDRLGAGEGGYEPILELMRSLAAPGEQRAYRQSEQGLQNRGQSNSNVGGAERALLQRELGGLDQQRQLGAFGESRAQQGFLGNMAGLLGGAGAGITGMFGQLDNDRFTRALGAYGAGQQGIDSALGRGTGLLGAAQGIDQGQLQAMLASAQMGGLGSEANMGSANFLQQGANTRGGFYSGLFGGADDFFSDFDWSSIFGG